MNTMRYLNTILTVLALLLALQLWTSWTAAGPETAAPAHAQGIPDEGAQRGQIVDQLKLLNRKADELQAVLMSGKVRVMVSMPQEDGEGQE